MTARPPSPSTQLSAFLSRFPPEIVARAKKCLPKLRRAFPGTTQHVYDYRSSVVVSFSPSEHGYEGVVSLAVDPRRVRLYFRKDVPDPEGRLEGAGSKVRSVVVQDASDLDHGDVHALIQAAIEHAGLTFPPTRSTRMVIKSSPKEKAPRSSSRPSRKRSASRTSS